MVTSKDLTTGETRTWRDSVIVDPNGQYEHIYWSVFRAEYGHTYHVEVTRPSDGAASFADVRVPELANVRLANVDDPHLQVLIEGEGIRALTPEVEYVVGGDSIDTESIEGTKIAVIRRYTISYQGKEEQTERGWLVTINMPIDHYWVDRWYKYDVVFGNYLRGEDEHITQSPHGSIRTADETCPTITLYGLNFRVIVGDSVWNPPDGRFDPKILSQPKVLSNVENGLGFVGAGYRIDKGLRPSRKAVERACFRYYDPPI